MLILKWLEVFFVVMLGIVVVTQIIVPAVADRSLFPFFRKQRKLENALIELHQRKAEKVLQNKIKSERNQNV